jgi:choline dehydrogenase-like flavoprotein
VGQGLRHESWPLLLHREIEAARRKPYKLGTHDCFIFACACAKAMTGVDYFAKWGGRYDSRVAALRAIKSYAGAGLAEGIDKLLGAERRRTILQARRGDWILYRDQGGEHIGICMGARVFVLTPDGLGSVALRDCVTAWEI